MTAPNEEAPRRVPAVARRKSKLSRRRELLVETNLRLVQIIARHVGARVPPCFDLTDLTGAGNEGLVIAARRFSFTPPPGDERSIQTRFRAFAKRHIEGKVIDVVRRRNWTEATSTHLEDIAPEARLFRDDRQTPEELARIREMRRELARTMQRMLTRQEQEVLRHVHGLGTPVRTIQDTAKLVGMNATNAGRVAREALAKLLNKRAA